MRRLIRFLGIAVMVTLVLIVGAMIYAHNKRNGTSLFGGIHTSDVAEVVFQVGDTTFSVPRNYLLGSASIKQPQGSVDGFIMGFVLPDLKPYSAETKAKFDELGWGAKVEVYVQAIGFSPPASQQFDNSIGLYSPAAIPFDAPKGVVSYWVPTVRGLGRDRFVLQQTEAGVVSFANCTTTDKAPSPSCYFHSDFSRIVTYEVTFARKFLSDWKTIDEKVRSRLSELIVKK